MSAFHPTKRDFIVVLAVTLLLGLFLQFDFSLRFTDSSGSDSLFGVKLGFGGRRGDDWEDDDRPAGRIGGGGAWLEDVDDKQGGGKGGGVVSMGQMKVKWGEEGAVRTEVLAHAPGE